MLPTPSPSIQENTPRRPAIPEDLVHQHVAKILSSRHFNKSKRLELFLKFIVTATLNGETESLKEWVIGTEVYNRGTDFDPRLDPIVRTEIRRLRRKLKEYYETEGQQDPLVIEVPKGSYVVNFRDQRDEDLFKIQGELIAGYFVLDRLDEGDDTVTYRVRDGMSARILAVTVISGQNLATSRMRQILDADVAAASLLQHENICRVYKLEPSGLNVCIVTDYFEGHTVIEALEASAPTWKQIVEIAVQLVAGLAAAHRQRITHGNLNPNSIRVAVRESAQIPVVKIVGFGLRSVEPKAAITGPGLFLSREDSPGASAAQRDVRGAGAILFQLLTGSLPESETTAVAWRPEVPEEYRCALSPVLARCLVSNPFEGYADAIELEETLALLGLRSDLPALELDEQRNSTAVRTRTNVPSVADRGPWPFGRRLVACTLLFFFIIAGTSGALLIWRVDGASPRGNLHRLGTPNGDGPSILDSSYHFTADVEIPPDLAEGVIVAQGGRFGGYGFYVLKGKPVFLYNFFDLQRTRWEGPDVLSPGKHALEFNFKYDGLGLGTLAYKNVSGVDRGGVGVLKVDGKEVSRQTIEHTVPLNWQWDENFDIGADTGTPVSNDYQVPFRFTGKLNKLTLTFDPLKLTPGDVKKLTAARRNNRARE